MIEEQFGADPPTFRIFVLHHHLSRAGNWPRTERRLRRGDRSSACSARGVHLVLSGHKHVPYAWRLENLFVVNTGTVSSCGSGKHEALLQRRRDPTGTTCHISRRHPSTAKERIIQFSTETFAYEKYTGRIEEEVTLREDETRSSAIVDGEHYPPRRPRRRSRR